MLSVYLSKIYACVELLLPIVSPPCLETTETTEITEILKITAIGET